MTKRLVKIAKELNVGTTTIVDYLNDHGFDIENKPTAKITNEMYNELLKEFSKSIAIKEEASKLVIGNRPSGKGDSESQIVHENGSNTTEPPSAEKLVESAESNANKNTQSIEQNHSSTSDTVELTDHRKENIPQPKIKVVGKIDLGSRLRSKAEKKQKSKARKEPKKYPSKKGGEQQRNVPQPNQDEPRKDQVEHKKEDQNATSKPAKEIKENAPEKIVAQPKDQQISKKENSQDINPTNTESPVAPGEEATTVRIEAPELRGLKIQGKIDIDKFKRPSKKKKDSKDAGGGKDKKSSGPENRNRRDRNENRGDRPKSGEERPRRERSERGDRDRDDRNRNDRDRSRSDDRNRRGRNDRVNYRDRGDRPERDKDKDRDDKNRNDRSERRRDNTRDDRSGNRPDNTRSGDSRGRNEGGERRRSSSAGGGGGRSDDRNPRSRTPRTDNSSNSGGLQPKPKDGTSSSGDSGGDGKKRRRTRKKVTINNKNRSSRDNGRNQRRKDNQSSKDEVKEVSQKEIEEKIKATMAKISGRGKKKRQRLQRDKRDRLREKQEAIDQAAIPDKLQLTEFVSVQELANLMDVPVTDVIMTCMNLGVIVSINQRLDAEVIELVASEFDHEVEFISAEEEVDEEVEEVDDPEDLKHRAPIVTVMGHVDHGKTSLLDYIRSATVASGEAGGITQHIGAYEVLVGEEEEDKKKITFLDTPGHEAFTAMRARGAKVTDIAIIVIAADDSIMPQTKEAISHAQAASVPIIFAINKIDKPGAQPERIKQELANMNLLVEEWGGDIQSQDISAKTGENIDLLLEKVLLEAEMLELQANPDKAAVGTVVEASLEKGRGYVTKMLVQAGTLKIGAPIVAGEVSGKVRAMLNERGKRVKTAGPSTPVLILGLDGAPQAGERFKQVDSDQEARQIASRRAQIAREQANRATKRISLDEIGRRLALGNFKELNLIIKGDVDGSVEALSDALIKQSIETVQVNVIHKAVGQIIESDVLLASASDAIIIGFQVRPSLKARQLAEREGVEIKTYSIIYEAIEQLKQAIEGMLEPDREEQIRAQVEVREVYKISKVGTVAGCYVQEGKINRNHHVRLIRNGIVTYPTKEGAHGELGSLKRFKDDVKEVATGFECGMTIKNYNDIKVGDIIEAYEIVEIKRKLT